MQQKSHFASSDVPGGGFSRCDRLQLGLLNYVSICPEHDTADDKLRTSRSEMLRLVGILTRIPMRVKAHVITFITFSVTVPIEACKVFNRFPFYRSRVVSNGHSQSYNIQENERSRFTLTLPWWSLSCAYGHSDRRYLCIICI